MANILILGTSESERQGLMLVLELAGHQCAEAGTLQAAIDYLRQNSSFKLVASDAIVGEAHSEEILRTVKTAFPQVRVLILTEETVPNLSTAPAAVEVITAPMSPMQNLPTSYSSVSRGDAMLVLLPEQDSLRMIPSLPKTAGMLNKLAVLYHSQEKFAAAEMLYKQALHVSQRGAGDKRSEMATILHNLANFYRDQQRYMDAEPLYRESITLAEKALGKNHPKVARRINNLAELYRVQGREAEAKAVLAKLN